MLRLTAAIDHACRQGNLKNCIFTAVGVGAGTTTIATRVRSMLESMGRPAVLVDASGGAVSPSQTSGQSQGRSTALMATDRASQSSVLMQQLSDEGEEVESLVLTDTAPLAISAETEYLARYVDAAIVVLESGVTTRAQLRAAADTLARLDVAAVGFVLNKVGLKNADLPFRHTVRAMEEHQSLQSRISPRLRAQAPPATQEIGAGRTPASLDKGASQGTARELSPGVSTPAVPAPSQARADDLPARQRTGPTRLHARRWPPRSVRWLPRMRRIFRARVKPARRALLRLPFPAAQAVREAVAQASEAEAGKKQQVAETVLPQRPMRTPERPEQNPQMSPAAEQTLVEAAVPQAAPAPGAPVPAGVQARPAGQTSQAGPPGRPLQDPAQLRLQEWEDFAVSAGVKPEAVRPSENTGQPRRESAGTHASQLDSLRELSFADALKNLPKQAPEPAAPILVDLPQPELEVTRAPSTHARFEEPLIAGRMAASAPRTSAPQPDRARTAPSPTLVTAQPEFLPPKPSEEAEGKGAKKGSNAARRDRHESMDDVEILPSWRGQYKKR